MIANPKLEAAEQKIRLRLLIDGAVQGVGFRPYIYHLARELHLCGWVCNAPEGVMVEVEGDPFVLESFAARIVRDRPPGSLIQRIHTEFLLPEGYEAFSIEKSVEQGERTVWALPDLAVCPDCVSEIFDPANRRFHYPFTNCTRCGPRFTIMEALPYDRPNTTMRHFELCADCREEYGNPHNRRFHAQPIACPRCGPRLELRSHCGLLRSEEQGALELACAALDRGEIVALKSLGGYQLLTDARNESAVRRLRSRKRRDVKPFALMYPGLEAVRRDCRLSRLEQELLCSAAAPIVLLERSESGAPGDVAASVAPGSPWLGVMLPFTPLHQLLLRKMRRPLVATSGNPADEPLCVDDHEALERLGSIADWFLTHNRPIAHHVDDSIVQVVAEQAQVLRRARGYAPQPVDLNRRLPKTLAMGGHLKNAIALCGRNRVFLSQHVGELDSAAGCSRVLATMKGLKRLFALTPEQVMYDPHPDYYTTRLAFESGLPGQAVQHHLAHALACMAEHQLEPPVLGVAWDGTGYGADGSVWGGEFFRIEDRRLQRAASLWPLRLPGGAAAVREPRRSALGALYELFGDAAFQLPLAPLQSFTPRETRTLHGMIKRNINTPFASSVGRLFDALAGLLNLQQRAGYEGQAALALQTLAGRVDGREAYMTELTARDELPLLDWRCMFREILRDLEAGLDPCRIARKFHWGLARALAAVAREVGIETVALSGGCFQNRLLVECAIACLREAGFRPYWPQQIPPNDGGLALGQIYYLTLPECAAAADDTRRLSTRQPGGRVHLDSATASEPRP